MLALVLHCAIVATRCDSLTASAVRCTPPRGGHPLVHTLCNPCRLDSPAPFFHCSACAPASLAALHMHTRPLVPSPCSHPARPIAPFHMCTLSARASSALLMQSFCRPLAPSPLMCTLSARPLAPSPHVCTLSARASSALLIQSFCPAHSAIPLCTLSARPSVPSPHSAHGPNRPRACLRVGPTLHAGWPHANARVEHVPRTPVPRTGCLPTCPHGSAHASASLAALHMHPPYTHTHATATHAALYMRPAPTCCAGSNSPVHVFRGARSGCHRASIRLWLCPHARPPCGARAPTTLPPALRR
jgi:hypothetical protein